MLHWLLRAKRLAQNPPSRSRVVLGLVVIGFCIALVTLEKLGIWPDWASAERLRPGFRGIGR